MTGSRDWADPERVSRELLRAIRDLNVDEPILVHGGCRTGADQQAEQAWIAAGRRRDQVEQHLPDWSAGKRGYFLRNKEMVDLQPTVCLAFVGQCSNPSCSRAPHPHPSHGAQMTIDLCEKAGVPIRRFYSHELEKAGFVSTLWLTRQMEKASASSAVAPPRAGAPAVRPWPIRPPRPAGA